MSQQSSSLSLAYHPIGLQEIDQECISPVEICETHDEDPKNMMVTQLCRPLLLLSSKSKPIKRDVSLRDFNARPTPVTIMTLKNTRFTYWNSRVFLLLS